MVRKVGLAGAAFLFLYAVASVVTGQRLTALGDLAQTDPAARLRRLHDVAGAAEPRPGARVLEPERHARRDVGDRPGGVDLLRSVPRRRAGRSRRPIRCSSCRAFRWRRRSTDGPSAIARAGSSTSSLLDLVLIALFSAFVYIYFVVSIAVTDGREDLYNDNLTQLLNARNLLLALWATYVWRTSSSPAWRRMLGVYALGLALTFVGGLVYDAVETAGAYAPGGLWDISFMAPYLVLLLAAAIAYDEKLFEPEEEAPALVEAAGRLVDRHRAAGGDSGHRSRSRGGSSMSRRPPRSLRIRLALAMMIPFGLVVVVARVPVAARLDQGGAGPGEHARAARAEGEARGGRAAGVGRGARVEQPAAGRARLCGTDAGGEAAVARNRGAARDSRQRQPRRRHRPQPAHLCRPHRVGAGLAADEPHRARRRGHARAAPDRRRHRPQARGRRSAAAGLRRSQSARGRHRQADRQRRSGHRSRGAAAHRCRRWSRSARAARSSSRRASRASRTGSWWTWPTTAAASRKKI